MQIHSLHSGDGIERATVMLDPLAATTENAMQIHITGPNNTPVPLPALHALLELLQHLGLANMRVSFS